MDLEILDQTPVTKTPWREVKSFFVNSRRQFQDWEALPPHALGLVILLGVSLEFVLMRNLASHLGFTWKILTQTLLLAGIVVLGELMLAKIGQQVGEFVNKKGRVTTALTFLNIGLHPLLLLLPVYLLSWLSGGRAAAMVVFLAALLLIKVLALWRESLEISFEFSRLQSTLVIYLAFGVVIVGICGIFYLSLISSLSSFLSQL